MFRALPPVPFLTTLLWRGFVLWGFVRGFSAFGLLSLGAAPADVRALSTWSTITVVAVVIALVRIEMSRRGELVFLANLGHSFARCAAIVGGECLGFEVIVRSVNFT